MLTIFDMEAANAELAVKLVEQSEGEGQVETKGTNAAYSRGYARGRAHAARAAFEMMQKVLEERGR